MRVSAAVALVAGMALASIAFLEQYKDAPASRSPWNQEANAVEAAHATVGVVQAFEKRVEALEARVSRAPDDRQLRLDLARLLHDGHRPGAAVEHYRRAIDLDPSDARPYYDLAAALREENRWDDAVSTLEARLAREPEDAIALYNLGAIRASQNRREEARRYWDLARGRTDDPGLLAAIDEGFARLKGR
jgi:tetratricopeptide (TPR) repeat protein